MSQRQTNASEIERSNSKTAENGVKFKCPSCGNLLQEEKFYEVCQEVRIMASQMAKQIIQEHFVELEIGYMIDAKRRNERLDTRGKEPKTSVLEDED